VETILKANKLPFRAIDVATDEAARKLWGRRSKGKKLPGLVKYGNIVGVCNTPHRSFRATANPTPPCRISRKSKNGTNSANCAWL
jgi:hypothetical protein